MKKLLNMLHKKHFPNSGGHPLICVPKLHLQRKAYNGGIRQTSCGCMCPHFLYFIRNGTFVAKSCPPVCVSVHTEYLNIYGPTDELF